MLLSSSPLKKPEKRKRAAREGSPFDPNRLRFVSAYG
jgi:hypothetical protein